MRQILIKIARKQSFFMFKDHESSFKWVKIVLCTNILLKFNVYAHNLKFLDKKYDWILGPLT